METPKHKPHTNIGSFLTPDKKDHADKVYEFLKADNITVLQQIEKLEADKAELLELMEELHGMFSDNPDMMGEYAELYKNKTERIIQKMKQ